MKRNRQTRPAPQSKENDVNGDKSDGDCEDQKLDPELKLLNSNSQSGMRSQQAKLLSTF